MKISNTNRTLYIQMVNTAFVVAILIIIFGVFIFYPKLNNKLILGGLVAIGLYLIHRLRGLPFFIYDSDGETLNFSNLDFFMFFGDPKVVKRAEFPKTKLLEFKILKNPFRKKLWVTVRSTRTDSNKSIQKFDVTYISKNELKDLQRSLEKVLKQNKEINHEFYGDE